MPSFNIRKLLLLKKHPLTNLLKTINPGFETLGAGGADVFANWVETAGDGAIAVETTLVHSGARACKMTRGTNVIRIDLFLTVLPATNYIWSFWTRADGTNAGRYSVFDSTHSSTFVNVTATGIAGTTYQRKSVSFTTPAGCTTIALQLYTSAVNGSIAYFDDNVLTVSP